MGPPLPHKQPVYGRCSALTSQYPVLRKKKKFSVLNNQYPVESTRCSVVSTQQHPCLPSTYAQQKVLSAQHSVFSRTRSVLSIQYSVESTPLFHLRWPGLPSVYEDDTSPHINKFLLIYPLFYLCSGRPGSTSNLAIRQKQPEIAIRQKQPGIVHHAYLLGPVHCYPQSSKTTPPTLFVDQVSGVGCHLPQLWVSKVSHNPQKQPFQPCLWVRSLVLVVIFLNCGCPKCRRSSRLAAGSLAFWRFVATKSWCSV